MRRQLVALALAGIAAHASAALQQPNVLVIIADDLGWPERPHLPALDALATQGVTFTRAYSQPTCSITRIEAMFGRLHRREGVGDLSMNAHDPTHDRLRFDLVSVAEMFNPQGYNSCGFGKWHLGRPSLQGEMDQVPGGPYVQGWKWRAGNPTVTQAGGSSSGYYNWLRFEAGDMFPEFQYATDVQRDQFVAWWTGNAGPKLAYLCWSAPHNDSPTVGGTPYDPPPGYALQATHRANYLQVVDYLDGALAAVLAAVSLADTYVVFCADNGTPEDANPGPPGVWKFTTHEGGVRVPLIVAGPGVACGVETDRLVSLVDLPATVAELAGVPIEVGFEDSMSFADELGAWPGAPARSWVFAERYDVVSIPNAGYDDQAVIEKIWKLRRVDPDGPGLAAPVDFFYALPELGVEEPLVPPPAVQARLIAELESLPARAP